MCLPNLYSKSKSLSSWNTTEIKMLYAINLCLPLFCSKEEPLHNNTTNSTISVAYVKLKAAELNSISEWMHIPVVFIITPPPDKQQPIIDTLIYRTKKVSTTFGSFSMKFSPWSVLDLWPLEVISKCSSDPALNTIRCNPLPLPLSNRLHLKFK